VPFISLHTVAEVDAGPKSGMNMEFPLVRTAHARCLTTYGCVVNKLFPPGSVMCREAGAKGFFRR